MAEAASTDASQAGSDSTRRPESASPVANETPTAIIGASGALGFALALRLGQAGVPVLIGSRDAGRARETVARALASVPGGSFAGAENSAALDTAATVILTVPFASHSETLANLRPALRPGQLLIDATVPLAASIGGRATRVLGLWQGSVAQQTLEMVPDGVAVVGALHTVSATLLADLEHPLAEDVLICGDSRAQKRRAALLIERIRGLRCVDCGALEMARITESLTALLISVNGRYRTHAGITLTGVPERPWQ